MAEPSVITIGDLEMIHIPPGSFLMGSDEFGPDSAAHELYLDGFYIARYPVTNTQYKKFVETARYEDPWLWRRAKYPKRHPKLKGDHPVVTVSWYDALAYCRWLSKKTRHEVRLPTEAEWEKTARGSDGRRYPWGDTFDESRCNTWESAPWDTTPVGKYSPQGDSPYGVGDLAGNVWEWCSSLFHDYPYDAHDGRENLEATGFRVVRGGAFDDEHTMVGCALRDREDPCSGDYDGLGFRVAVSLG